MFHLYNSIVVVFEEIACTSPTVNAPKLQLLRPICHSSLQVSGGIRCVRPLHTSALDLLVWNKVHPFSC